MTRQALVKPPRDEPGQQLVQPGDHPGVAFAQRPVRRSGVGRHRSVQQHAEPVQVRHGPQMQLNPVTTGPVAPDRGITTDVIAHLNPSRPGDPKVNHARSLQMSDFPAAAEQRRLTAEAGPAFPGRTDRKHRGNESIPPRVVLARVHTVIVDTGRRDTAHNCAQLPRCGRFR